MSWRSYTGGCRQLTFYSFISRTNKSRHGLWLFFIFRFCSPSFSVCLRNAQCWGFFCCDLTSHGLLVVRGRVSIAEEWKIPSVKMRNTINSKVSGGKEALWYGDSKKPEWLGQGKTCLGCVETEILKWKENGVQSQKSCGLALLDPPAVLERQWLVI